MNLCWKLSPQLYAWKPTRAVSQKGSLPSFIVEGLTDAQLAGYRGVEVSSSLFSSPERGTDFAAELRTRGLAPATLFCEIRYGVHEKLSKMLFEQVAIARGAGFNLLDVAIVPTPGSDSHNQAKEMVEILTMVRSGLASEDITVCWHPHGEDYLSHGAIMTSVLTSLNGFSKFGLCLDVGWVMRSGQDIAEIIGSCPCEILLLHLRDYNGTCWTQCLGEGQINKTSPSALKKMLPSCRWHTVELFFDRQTQVTRTLFENAQLCASWALERS